MSIYDECMYCNQDITNAPKDTLSKVNGFMAHNTCFNPVSGKSHIIHGWDESESFHDGRHII